jgi:hypothetical protein
MSNARQFGSIVLLSLLISLVTASAQNSANTTVNPIYNHVLSIKSGRVPNMRMLYDYSRVPVASPEHFNLVKGKYRDSDIVIVTYVRNEGGRILWNNEDHFVPLVCFYQSANRRGPLIFTGCWNNATSSTYPGQSNSNLAPDAFFTPNVEVYFATRIIVEIAQLHQSTGRLIRDTNLYQQMLTSSPTDLYEDGDVTNSNNNNDNFYCENTNDDQNSPRITKPLVELNLPIRTQTMSDKLRTVYNTRDILGETNPGVTPAVQAVMIYLRSFMTREYASFLPYFDDDITFSVEGLTNYTGKFTAYYYQILADFQVSDSIRINGIGSLVIISTGHMVMFQVQMLSDFPNTPGPLSIWNNKYMVLVEFNRYGKMKHFTQHVDLMSAYIRTPPVTNVSANHDHICSVIQRHCTSNVTVDLIPGMSSVQYTSMDDCKNYLQSIPQDGPTPAIQTMGKNVACISWHTSLIPAYPQHHCMHSGKQVISPVLTPCQDW